MKVDRAIEPLVREVFASAVAEDPEWFERALEALADRGDAVSREALGLAAAIDSAALFLLHGGQRPDTEELERLASEVVQSESWIEISTDAVSRFLRALVGDGPSMSEVLPIGDLAVVDFVVGAWLLAAFLPEDKTWTDFLDQVLVALEKEPSPR